MEPANTGNEKPDDFFLSSPNPLELSQEEQFVYVEDNLKIIAEELAPAFTSKNLKRLIYNKVNEQFDGEHNVLVKDLLHESEFSEFLTPRMEEALAAFQNIGEENFYPHIYIPNFDQFYPSAQNPSGSDVTTTELAFFNGNEELTTVSSYINHESGLVVQTQRVKEDYTDHNELLILALNESVDNNGDVHIPPIVNAPAQTLSIVNFRIKEMTIKDAKESWLGGKSEIHIKSYLSTWNRKAVGATSGPNQDYNSIRSVPNTNFEGFRIAHMPKAERGYRMLNLNYPLQTAWNVGSFYSNTPVYPFVIFEYDVFPSPSKTAVSKIPSAAPADQDVFLNFRSSDRSYGGANAGFPENVNFAIYGNVDGFPTGSTQRNLFYNPYIFGSLDMDLHTESY